MIDQPIAVCGIDCTHCPILKAFFGDVEAAEQLVRWWRSEGWMGEDEGVAEVLEGSPHCLGCRGDRSRHWEADCWILTCCVDDRGLEFCHECGDFACQPLVEWGAQNDGYTKALNRLHHMKVAVS